MAVVKCKEDYESLRESLGNVTNSVNKLIEEGEIDVDGVKVPLDFYLGGDYKVIFSLRLVTNSKFYYKYFVTAIQSNNILMNANQIHECLNLILFHIFFQFLLISMGMMAANSSHSCVWCLVAAKDR